MNINSSSTPHSWEMMSIQNSHTSQLPPDTIKYNNKLVNTSAQTVNVIKTLSANVQKCM